MVLLLAFINGCATTGSKEKTNPESYAESIMFRAYIESAATNEVCCQYARELDELLQALDGNSVEPENLRVTIIEPVTMTGESEHPVRGQWRLSFDLETQEDKLTYNFLQTAVRNSRPIVELQMMGGTLTDPVLQADLVFPVILAALLETKKLYPDYDEPDSTHFIVDTEVTESPSQISGGGRVQGPWKEQWMVRYYDSKPPIPVYIDFNPKAGAGTDFAIHTDSVDSIDIMVLP
jgi:hypothetical protein